MALLVTTNPSCLVKEGFELEPPLVETSISKGVGNASTTQVSASGAIAQLPFITRCWNAVTGVALAIWKVVSGVSTWIWGYISAPFRRELVVSEVGLGYNLGVLAELLIQAKCSPPKTDSEVEMGHAQIRTVYDQLNFCVKEHLQREVYLCMLMENKHNKNQKTWELNEDGTVDIGDIIDAYEYHDIQVPRIIKDTVKALPSSKLTIIENKLSNAITDKTRIELLLGMIEIIEIIPSDLEPQMTNDVLNTRVLMAFDAFRNSLKKEIYVQIQTFSRSSFRREERPIEVGGIEVSIDDDQFPVLAVRRNPCGDMMIRALSAVRDGLGLSESQSSR